MLAVILSLAAVAVVPTSAPAQALAHDPATVPQISISATMVVIDREALSRAGLTHVVLGDGRVRLGTTGVRRAPRGVRGAIAAGGLGVQAFIDLAREQRWVRSEYTQQVTVLSGSQASLSSSTLRMGGMGARTSGPSLVVTPTVREDGSVHLRLTAEVADVATDRWGYPIDGSPVAAHTELVVGDGEQAIVASGSGTETSRRVGLLRFTSTERDREVLITVTPRILAAP